MENSLIPEALNVPSSPSNEPFNSVPLPDSLGNGIADLLNQVPTLSNPSSNIKIPTTPEIDPAVAKLQGFAQAPISSDYQASPVYFDYDRSNADRYVNSKYYKQLGFDPGLSQDDTEFRYGALQTWSDTMGNALGGAYQLGSATFVEGWKGWGRMAEALFTWDSSKLMGSPEEQLEMAKFQEDVLNKYAIYDTAESRDSIFNRQLFGNMLQQSGFALGAAAQMLLEYGLTAGIGSAIGAASKASMVGRLIKGGVTLGELANDTRKVANTITRSEKILNLIKEAPKALIPLYETGTQIAKYKNAGAGLMQLAAIGAGGIKRELSMFNMARSEAIFESAQSYADLREKLTDEYIFSTGQAPTADVQERIDQFAEDNAHDNFWTNTGLLTVMNRIQLDNLVKSFDPLKKTFTSNISDLAEHTFKVTGKIGDKTVTQGFTKGFLGEVSALPKIAKTFGKKTAAWEATKMAGKGLMKFEGSEGVQELLQEASSKGLTDYYYDLYHGKKGFGTKMDAVLESVKNPLTDKDGMKTFLMGALTGRLISPITGAVTTAVKYKDNIEKRKKAEEALKVVNDFFRKPESTVYTKEWIANTKVQNKAAETMEEAAANGDKYTFYNVKDSAFAKVVASAIKLDMYDSLKDSLLELGQDLNETEFKEAFGMEFNAKSKGSVKNYMKEIVDKVENYYNVYNNLRTKYADKIIPEIYKNNDPKEYARAILAKKVLDDSIEMLATNAVLAQRTVVRASDLQQQMAANQTIGGSTNEIVSRLGSETLIETEIKRLETEVNQLTSPDITLSDDQKEILKQKKEELRKVKLFQNSYNSVMGKDDESEFPGSEENFYQSFKELVTFYNERAKITTPISTEDIDSAFMSFFDYLRLNKDHQSYVDAMNFLADPNNLKLLVNAQRSGREFVNEQFAKEHIKEIQNASGEKLQTEGKKITVKLKDKNGNIVEQELVEGEEYITEAFPEVRVFPKQKVKTTAYKQNVIKVVGISGDNIIINIDDTETVTYSVDEFQDYIGKLYPLKNLTNDQRIFFKNRNKRFKLNVRSKTGKRHLIYGKHKGIDYSQNGVDVEAQLELEKTEIIDNEPEPEMIYDEESDTYYYDNTPKQKKFGYVLMISYINPVTKLKEKFKYDQTYIDQYSSDKYDILDITIDEAEFMRREDDRRRNAQVNILNTALTETIEKVNEQTALRKELEATQQKLQTDLEDFIAEMELLEEFLTVNKSKRSKKIAQLKAENKERLIVVSQLIENTKQAIEKNRELLMSVEEQLEVLERAVDFYERGLTILNERDRPFTISNDGIIYQQEVNERTTAVKDLVTRPERRDPVTGEYIHTYQYNDERLNKTIEETQAEVDIITANIQELENILERLNTLLGKILAFEDVYNLLSTVSDKEQLRNELKLMERQVAGETEETDNYKLLAKSQLLKALRLGLAKGDLGIEFQYTLELINQLKEANDKIKFYHEELSNLQPKLESLKEEQDSRKNIAVLNDRINVLKFIQQRLVDEYKIRQERAGVKVEGTKVIVTPSLATTPVAAVEDDLIKGSDSILVSQVVEDLIPEGKEEEDSFEIISGAVPVLGERALFKSAGRHFEDLNDTRLNSKEDARYFKFSETAKLRQSQADGGGVVYYFLPVTKDSKEFQDIRVTELADGTKFEDDIRLVVVKKDAAGNYKPVDINGNILEKPTKDNMVYTAMLGDPNLIGGNKEKMIEWVEANFVNKNNSYTKDQIFEIATNFVNVRNTIKDRIAKGENVFLPIEEKSPGRFNREPKTANERGQIVPQELSLKGRLIEENPDYKNLKHPDGSTVKLTVTTLGNNRVRPGRMLMIKNDDPTSGILVYNRKFTEKEHENIIEVLKRMSELFTLKATGALDEQSDIEFQNGVRYLQGLIHWFKPAEGKVAYPFQMWVSNGLHIGTNVIEFTKESIELNKAKIIEALPYHKINNVLLKEKYETQSFPEVSVVDGKIVVGKKYFNYQEYLLTDREGGSIVYTNIKPYVAPSENLQSQDFQLKNVYLRYSVDHIAELPALAAPTKATTTTSVKPEEKGPVAESTSELKKYSASLTQGTLPDGRVIYSLVSDIPNDKNLTFVRMSADGVTEMYVHTEPGENGVPKVIKVVNAKGEDRSDVIAANQTAINTFYNNYLNEPLLKAFDNVEYKDTVEDYFRKFYNVYTSIEDYSQKGELSSPVTEDAKQEVIITAPAPIIEKAVDKEYDDFVSAEYEVYLSDPKNLNEDALSEENFEEVFRSKLKEKYKKSKETKGVKIASKKTVATEVNKIGVDYTIENKELFINEPGGKSSVPVIDYSIDTKESFEGTKVKVLSITNDAVEAEITYSSGYTFKQTFDKTDFENKVFKVSQQAPVSVEAKPAVTPATKTKFTAEDLLKLSELEDNDDVPFDPNARVEVESEKEKARENITAFKQWMQENLPMFPIDIFDELIDARYGGQFYNGVVRLYKNAEVGTGFHEAFEAVWNALLTEDKKSALIEEYKKRPDYVSDKHYVWAKANYRNLNENGIIKEALAEEFREYMLTNAANIKANSPKRNTFFRKIWNFILKILGLSDKAKSDIDNKIEQLFSDISTGEFRKAEIVTSYDPYEKHNKAIKGLSVEFTELLMEGMTAMFFNQLYSDQQNITELFDPKNKIFEVTYSKILSRVSSEFRPGYSAMTKHPSYQQADDETKIAATEAYNERRRNIEGADLYDQKLTSILLYNSEVKERFKQYLSQFGLMFTQVETNEDEIVDQILDKENTSNTLGIQDVMYVDPTTMSSPLVRLLILGLTEDILDTDGKITGTEKNAIGLDTLVPFKKKMNTLLNELSNIVPVHRKQADGTFKQVSALQLMYEKLNKKFKDSDHPNRYKKGYTWLGRMFNRLRYDKLINGEPLTDNELRLILAFENSFNRNKNVPIKVIVGLDGRIREVNAISVTTKQKIKEEWRNSVTDKQLKREVTTTGQDRQDILVINTAGFIEINLKSEELKRAMTSSTSVQDKMRTLAKLGIKLSKPSAYFSNEEINIINTSFATLRTVFDDFEKRNERFFYSQLFDRRTVTGPLNRLLDIEFDFRSEDMLLSHLTPENKTQYAITLPSEISFILSSLNSVNRLDEFIMTNPQYGKINDDGSVTLHKYNSTSEILKPGGLIFDINGVKYKNAKGENSKNIEYVYIQGMASDQENEGDNTDKLEQNDKIVQEMYHILMHGTYYSVINSDKSSEFGVKMGHFISTQDISDNNLIEQKYLEALRAELLHAFQFHFFPNNIDNHQQNILSLGHFKGILKFSDDPAKQSNLQKVFLGLINSMKITPKTSKKTVEQLFTLAADNFISEVKNQSVIKKYVEEQIEEHKNWLLDKKIIKYNEETKRFETLSIPEDNPLLGADVKSMTNVDFNKLVKFIIVNRQLSVYEQHKLFFGHPALYKDLPKRTSGANSQKNVVSENRNVIIQMNNTKPRFDGVVRNPDRLITKIQTYSDPKVTSSNIQEIAEILYSGFMQTIKDHDKVSKMIGAEFDKKTGKLKKLNITKTSLLKSYAEMEEADGQAYIMPDYFRDLLYLSSLLSKEQEELLNYENALEVVERSSADPSSSIYKVYSQDVIDNAKELLKKDKPEAILQPLKPQGFGFALSENMSHLNMYKSSVFPLTWSRVKGNPTMLAKYIDAQNKGADMITFKSGHKVGAIKDPKTGIPSIYNEKGEVNNVSPNPIEMLSRFISIQVQTADYAKDKVIFGSQIRKIILGNLPESLKGKRDYYISLINELIDIETTRLLDEMGLKLENGIYKTVNLEKLVTTLKDQAIRRGLPDNVVDMLEVVTFDETQQLRHPFDANPARERIEYVLTALVDSRLVRSEMFGKAAVQVSSVMFESEKRDLVYLKDGVYQKVENYDGLTPAQKKTVTLTSGELKFYNKDNPKMEVYLPWFFEGISPADAGFIQTKSGVWVSPDAKATESLLKAIGFRIPSQAFNSVDSIQIKGFLDPSYGDAVVVPSEIVGKSGSDFDIDKLNMFLKNYSLYEGELSVIKFSREESELEDRYINKVKEIEEKDINKLLLSLSLEERNQIREEFREKKEQIKKELDGKYYDSRTSLEEEQNEKRSDLNLKLADSDSYFKEVYELGKKVYRSLSPETKLFYNAIKNYISSKGIKGPKEIEMYLERTIQLRESDMYPDDNKTFDNLITLYKEELKILGYQSSLKDYESTVREYYKGKRDELRKEIKETGRLKVREISNEKNDKLKTIRLEMAKQSARIMGYYSLEEFAKLDVVKQNNKKALQNELIDVMSEIIEHPENRRQLLMPNSVQTIKGVADYIVELRGYKSYVENDMTKLSEWKTMSETRETFVSSKQLVGSGAQHITSHAMAQIGEVELTGVYMDRNGEMKNVNVKLKNSNTNKLDLTIDADSLYIFDLISEALSGSVDAAKDPFIYELRLNLETASTWFYLTKRGVPQKDIALFFNQPILDTYFANKSSNNTYVNRTNDTKLSYNELLLETIKPYYEIAYGKPLIISEKDSAARVIQLIKGAVQNKYSKYETAELEQFVKKGKSLSKEDALKQIAILFDALDYMEQGNMLFNFIQSITYDTARTKTINEYTIQRHRYNKVFGDKFITEDSMERVFSRTFLSKIKEEKEKMLTVFSEFFVTLHKDVVPAFTPLIKQIEDRNIFMSESDKIELLKRYQSYVVTYILQNTPYGKEKAIKEYFDLFRDNEATGKLSFPKLLKKLKERYPTNQALQSLFPIISDNRYSTDNIKLFNNSLSSYEINVLSTSIENLMEKSKKEDDVELKEFIENLTRFTILQSGIQNSPITFTKAMPISLYSNTVSRILRTFISESEGLDISQIWKTFHQNYYKNNLIVPKIRSKKLYDGLLSLKQENSFSGYDYVKMYKLRQNVTKEMIKQGHLKFEEMFEIKLFEKIKVYDKTGVDITDTLRSVSYRPINVLGNGMYLLETSPADMSGKSRLETNESFDETDFDETVSNYISVMEKSTDSETPTFDRLPEYNPQVSNKTYAGIGSRGEKGPDGKRTLPDNIKERFIKAIKRLNDLDYTARTGDAVGSDNLVRSQGKVGKVEVFTKEDADMTTRAIAAEIHPNPDALVGDSLDLMARNTYQVFGENLDSPVDFVLVYEPSGYDGSGARPERGGSNQAIDMAYRKGIPVINIALDNWETKFEALLTDLSKRAVIKATPKKPKQKKEAPKPAVISTVAPTTTPIVEKPITKLEEDKLSLQEQIEKTFLDLLQKLAGTTQLPSTTPTKSKFGDIKLLGEVSMKVIDELVKQGKATSTVRNPDYHKSFYKGAGVYRTETGTVVKLTHRGSVKLENNRVYGSQLNLSKEEFAQKEGFGTWLNFIDKAKWAGKRLLEGKSVEYYDVEYIGDAGPMFDDLSQFTKERKVSILSNFATKHKMKVDDARKYINDALVKVNRDFVISKLNECY